MYTRLILDKFLLTIYFFEQKGEVKTKVICIDSNVYEEVGGTAAKADEFYRNDIDFTHAVAGAQLNRYLKGKVVTIGV